MIDWLRRNNTQGLERPFKLLVPVLYILLALGFGCADDNSNGEGNGLECLELCHALCDSQVDCEEETNLDVTAETCHEGCEMIGLVGWGESVNMAPLACSEKEDCDEFEICHLLGGEGGFSCGGFEPEDVEVEEGDYSKDCEGVCYRMVDCEFESEFYFDECIRYCGEAVSEGWRSAKAFVCVDALSCERFINCTYALQYDDQGWEDGDGPNVNPPDGGVDVDPAPDNNEPDKELPDNPDP